MIIYYFILLIFTINTALASNLDKPNDIVNPLDSLANTQPAHCMSDSDTELDEDDDMQDNSNNIVEKRQLDKPEAHPQPEKKAKIYRFNCPYANCNFMSDHSINIKKHIRIHTGERPYSCNHQGCTYAAAQQKDLATHVNTIHQSAKEKEPKNRFICTYSGCHFRTSKNSNLIIHNRVHTGERPFKCGYAGCGYSAKRKTTLINHKKTHTGEKPFKCDFAGCNYCAARKENLVIHKSRHTGEKPYVCPYSWCGFAAPEGCALSKHVLVHTGEQPYKCTECSFATAHLSSLSVHKKIHTGEKKFKCDYAGCPFASITSSDLVQHIKKIHNAKPYQCDKEGCTYATTKSKNLAEHKKSKHIQPTAPSATDLNVSSNSAVIKLLINAGKNKTKGDQ